MEPLREIDENTFLISDTHLFHDRIVEYEPVRKRYLEEGFPSHEDWIIDNWNSVVGERDLVLHLGDFIFKPQFYLEFAAFLNGRKLFVAGNHDAKGKLLDGYSKYFEAVVGRGKVAVVSSKGIEIIETDHFLANGIVTTVGGIKILFSHYPVFVPEQYRSKAVKALEKIFHDYRCDINIHGHVHSKTIDHPRLLNVSFEAIGFKPIRLKELLERKVDSL